MRQLEWGSVNWLLGLWRTLMGWRCFCIEKVTFAWCHWENLKIEHEILKVPCYANFSSLHISCPDSHDKEKHNSLGQENCFSFLWKLKFPCLETVWKLEGTCGWGLLSATLKKSVALCDIIEGHTLRSKWWGFSHNVARATFARNMGPLKPNVSPIRVQRLFHEAAFGPVRLYN